MELINFIKPVKLYNQARAYMNWTIISSTLLCASVVGMTARYITTKKTLRALQEEHQIATQRKQQFDALEQELTTARSQRDQIKELREKRQHSEQALQQKLQALQAIQQIVAQTQAVLQNLTMQGSSIELSLSAPNNAIMYTIHEQLTAHQSLSSLMVTSLLVKEKEVVATIKGFLK